MKCILLNLLCCICYSTSQFASMTRRLPKSPCESPNKNSLVEHFFNTIFTELQSTPPVCVCVQMCAGQSTYCYPNGCLKTASAVQAEKENSEKTIEKTLPPQMQKTKNQFMLVKDDQYDFMTDFLERNYVDETKAPPKINNPVHDLRPDPFKDKYRILGKYKKAPKIELRYNLQEKVKNAKSDTKKVEGWAKTNWSTNRNNRIRGFKLFSDVEKPLKAHGAFFRAMLPDSEIAEYPPKYFKRDLTKVVDFDDGNTLKAFYMLDNSLNVTDTLSLETLIDNLIQSSFGTSVQNETMTELLVAKRDKVENEMKATTESPVIVNSTVNETTRIISMNLTDENVDKNKYEDDNSQTNKTSDVKDMIMHFAKQIEQQNNTSMEIAKRTISDLNESILNANKDEDLQLNSTLYSTESNTFTTTTTTVENSTEPESTAFNTYAESETTTLHEIIATKKNRQKVVKKFASGKMN